MTNAEALTRKKLTQFIDIEQTLNKLTLKYFFSECHENGDNDLIMELERIRDRVNARIVALRSLTASSTQGE